MQALQTKLETLTNQNSDCKQHIDVLKESLNAKEQRANTLQTEVSANTRAQSQEKTVCRYITSLMIHYLKILTDW